MVFLDAWIIPVSEEFVAFIAPLSLSAQSVVSGRHLSHRSSRHVFVEVSVTEQILPPRTHRAWDKASSWLDAGILWVNHICYKIFITS